jgi:FtsP/CotA-like multicopper oxidase with cupredoxin domain
MELTRLKRLRWLLVPLLVVPIILTHGGSSASAKESGILCTRDDSNGTNPHFSFTAGADYISMPDGNTMWTWSYHLTGGHFQFPGPQLCVKQGDNVTIVLHNSLPEATSIVFPGIDNVQANGAPAQTEVDGSGVVTSLTNTAAANTGSVTYSFTAKDPGTYLYESGTDPGKQVQMGLYGALIVRPSAGDNLAYGADTQFDTNTEFVMLLSELDPNLHSAVEQGQPYDVTTLHPRYWLINGRSFPDTIAPNNAPWLPNQPYGALIHIKVTDVNATGSDIHDPALIRYLNAGSKNHPFHPHGQNGRLVGRDGSPLVNATGGDLSYETFAFSIGSGETWDQLYHYDNQEHFDENDNPIPVTIPQLENLTFKDAATYYSGSPYLGEKGQLPIATTSYNECGEYYMVAHSHALNEVANYDAGFGGMLTLERIDPLKPAKGTTCTGTPS